MKEKYLSTKQFAAKHKKSISTIKRYCLEGLIKGAFKPGDGITSGYVIPVNAKLPKIKTF